MSGASARLISTQYESFSLKNIWKCDLSGHIGFSLQFQAENQHHFRGLDAARSGGSRRKDLQAARHERAYAPGSTRPSVPIVPVCNESLRVRGHAAPRGLPTPWALLDFHFGSENHDGMARNSHLYWLSSLDIHTDADFTRPADCLTLLCVKC